MLYISFVVVFFFFKQKTAYEMRISDWSSDVCSSDLRRGVRARAARRCDPRARGYRAQARPADPGRDPDQRGRRSARGTGAAAFTDGGGIQLAQDRVALFDPRGDAAGRVRDLERGGRSEEHTSELQSLMRISYAVFCLKKHNTNSHEIKQIAYNYTV